MAIPYIVQRQIKIPETTPPAGIVEWLGLDEEDTIHPRLAMNGFERLAVHKLLPQEVSMAYAHVVRWKLEDQGVQSNRDGSRE